MGGGGGGNRVGYWIQTEQLFPIAGNRKGKRVLC